MAVKQKFESDHRSPLVDRVLFIDGEAIVLDKPAGLPVDPPRDGSLSLENHLASLTFGFERWPSAVHRLDRDTSGCLLLSRNPKAHKRFAEAFATHAVEKCYVAVLDGIPAEAAGTIDLPLGKTSTRETGWRMVVASDGKPAVTDWQIIAQRDGRALVQFGPHHGRTHQIRAHALHGIGIGITGDPVYGTGQATGRVPLLLHAWSLHLDRAGKPPVAVTAPLPERFLAAGFTDADLPSPASQPAENAD